MGSLAAKKFINLPQGALLVRRKRGASGQQKCYTSSIYTVNKGVHSSKALQYVLDSPAVRNANRGDPRESIRTKMIFITCKRFARIASSLRLAILNPPKRDSQKRGLVREP